MILLLQEAGDVRERALSLFAGRARRALGLPRDACILITSNGELRELNRRHRQMDRPTDVLSFPSVVPDSAGDIAISMEIAAANAAELGHSAETELKILILHGLLHLAGYDHERDKGRMQARETQLRQKFKLPGGLIERTQKAGDERTRRAPRKAAASGRRKGSRR